MLEASDAMSALVSDSISPPNGDSSGVVDSFSDGISCSLGQWGALQAPSPIGRILFAFQQADALVN
jgi:hypothetical protein